MESLDYIHTTAKSLPKPPAQPHVRSHGVTSRGAPWRSASLHRHGGPVSSPCHILFTGITMLHPSHLLPGLGYGEDYQHPWKITALKVEKANWSCWSSSWALHGQASRGEQQIQKRTERILIALARIRLHCVTRLHGNAPLSLEMGKN